MKILVASPRSLAGRAGVGTDKQGLMNSRLGASLILIVALTAGCSSLIYGWHVRTNSSPPFPSLNQVVLGQEPVAIFGALAQPGLLRSEIGSRIY